MKTSIAPNVRMQSASLTIGGLAFPRLFSRNDSSGAETAGAFHLLRCQAGIDVESDAGILHAVRRRRATAAAKVDDKMIVMGSGDEIQLRFRGPAGASERLDPRLSAFRGRMGEGSRREYGTKSEYRAASIPCDEPVPLPRKRAVSG